MGSTNHRVLLPNRYYHAGRDTTFGPTVLEKASDEWRRIRAIRTKRTIPPVMGDIAALLRFTDQTDWIAGGAVGSHR